MNKKFVIFLTTLTTLSALHSSTYALDVLVTTTLDEADGPDFNFTHCTDGNDATLCSLREAFLAVVNSDEDSTITLQPGLYALTRLTNNENVSQTGDLDFMSERSLQLTSTDADPSATIIDGLNDDRILQSIGSGSLTLNNLTFRNGRFDPNFGGAVFKSGGSLSIDNCIFESNQALRGGAIYSSNNTAISNSLFRLNQALEWGGAISGSGSSLTIEESRFFGNQAQYGAGIYGLYQLGAPAITITGSTFGSDMEPNHASIEGGALFLVNTAGTVTVSETTIQSNTADVAGGGIFLGIGPLDNFNSANVTTLIERSTLSGNSAGFAAGGFYHEGGTVTIRNSTVSGNQAGSDGGGAAFLDETAAFFEHATVTANQADNGEGGLKATASATLEMQNSLIALNPGADCISINPIISANFNLDSDGSCGLTGAEDQSNVNDPKLGPLADNGGPTLTHALLADSFAIDAAILIDGLTTDQRGQPRNQDGDGDQTATPDIGAYEVAEVIPAEDDNPEPVPVTDDSIAEANAEIDFDNLTEGDEIQLTAPTPGDADLSMCSCEWTFTGDAQVAIDDSNSCIPTIQLEQEGDLTIQVAVDCDAAGSEIYTQGVTVHAASQPATYFNGGGGCTLVRH